MRAGSGLSLLELIVVVAIVAVVAVSASLQYTGVVDEARRDKALSDLQQLKKVLLQYESSLPTSLTSYGDISSSDDIHDLARLVEYRLMPSIPADPWGGEYRIDIEAGIIYCAGPDGVLDFHHWRYEAGLSCHDALMRCNNDIYVRHKPEFSAERARVGPRRETIEVDFTRPVDYTVLTTDTSFSVLDNGVAVSVTTTVVDILNRHKVRIRLVSALSQAGPWSVTVSDGADVRAVDAARLPQPVVLPVAR